MDSIADHLGLGTQKLHSTLFQAVTGSRMHCRVITVEGLPRCTGLNSSWQVFQRSLIGVPVSGVASSTRQDTIPVSPGQYECRHIPRNPTVTNSTERRISSQHPQSALDVYIRATSLIQRKRQEVENITIEYQIRA